MIIVQLNQLIAAALFICRLTFPVLSFVVSQVNKTTKELFVWLRNFCVWAWNTLTTVFYTISWTSKSWSSTWLTKILLNTCRKQVVWTIRLIFSRSKYTNILIINGSLSWLNIINYTISVLGLSTCKMTSIWSALRLVRRNRLSCSTLFQGSSGRTPLIARLSSRQNN